MVASWNSLLSHEAIIQMVGHEAFARAMVYAKSGHVYDVNFDADALIVTGRVKGTVRDDYAVTVFLASSRSGSVSVYRSQCSCPVGIDCKHAAAVLIVARHLVAGPTVERPEWERTLDKLLAAAPPVSPRMSPPWRWSSVLNGFRRFGATSGGRICVSARHDAAAAAAGCVRGSPGMISISSPAHTWPNSASCCCSSAPQLARARDTALPRSAWLSLGTVSSAFWGLLDQAATVGLTILAAKPLLGPIRTKQRASVILDVRRDPAVGVLVGPRVLLDDRELELSSVGVLGDPAHGVFYVAEEAGGVQQLIVARLEQLLSRELRQLVVDPHSLLIPSDDEARFLTDFIPRLRQKMTITSADRSVRLPDYIEPTVGVVVHFRPEHRVRLDWMVQYDLP